MNRSDPSKAPRRLTPGASCPRGRSVAAGIALVWSLTSFGGAAAAAPGANASDALIANAELSADSRLLVDWIIASDNNAGSDFLIVDKKAAMLHVFNFKAELHSSSPVLLGATVSDDNVPGIGRKAIADVLDNEKTTPAGRFVAERGRNAKGVDVIWIDYDAALSMHRVINEVPAERRLQRLASPTSDDNRISFGCINVPVAYFESAVRPMFEHYRAIVYILPEVRSMAQVFGIESAKFARQSAVLPQ